MEQAQTDQMISSTKPLVTPVLGTYLGPINAKTMAYLEKLKQAKQKEITDEANKKSAEADKIAARLEKLAVSFAKFENSDAEHLTEEQKREKQAELATLEAEILDSKKKIGKPFLGIFPKGSIKALLHNLEARYIGQLASFKTTLDSPKILAKMESGVIEAQKRDRDAAIVRNAEKAKYEEAQKKHDSVSEAIWKSDRYEKDRAIYAAKKAGYEEDKEKLDTEVEELTKEAEAVAARYDTKMSRLNGMFEGIATVLNKVDVFVRQVVSGQKADFTKVGGLDQSAVLSAQAMADFAVLNDHIQEALRYAKEGKELVEEESKKKSGLGALIEKAKSLTDKLVPEKKAQLDAARAEREALKQESKDLGVQHRKDVRETTSIKGNVVPIIRGDGPTPISRFDPTEINGRISEAMTRIQELEAEKVALSRQVITNSVEQEAQRKRLAEIEAEIKHNTLARDIYLDSIDEITAKYGVEALKAYTPASDSPFDVRVDVNGLGELERERLTDASTGADTSEEAEQGRSM